MLRNLLLSLLLSMVTLAPSANAQVCGDCDQSGSVSILDALAAAQHGVGLITLTTPEFELCDVDGSTSLGVLDALAIARLASGLPPLTLSCVPAGSQRPTAFVGTPPGEQFGDVTISYRLADANSSTCTIAVTYSIGGGPRMPATERPGAPSEGTTGLSSTPAPGTTHTFVWDSMADLGMMEPDVQIFVAPSDGGGMGIEGASAIIAIRMPDMTPPTIDHVTINEVLAIMNGSPASPGGTLNAPTTGFTIDVDYSDVGRGIDPSSLVVTSDNALGSVGAGVNFASAFTATATEASVTVSASAGGMDLTFPSGMNTVRVSVSDLAGNPSAQASFSFMCTPQNDANRPFETRQIWFLKTDRDIVGVGPGPMPEGTTKTTGSNGTADFLEDLLLFGLNSTSPIAVPGFTGNSNDRAIELILETMIAHTRDLYGVGTDTAGMPVYDSESVNIDFTGTEPAGGPMTMAIFPYAAFPYSQLAVGGFNPTFDVGGLAMGDFMNNANQDNDATFPGDPFSAPFMVSVAFGDFPLRTYEVYFPLQGMGFGFEPFIEGVDPRYGGTPIGEHPQDATVLDPTFDRTSPGNPAAANDRFDDVMAGAGAYGIRAVTAHEAGHSMGLVKDGNPPMGLYGNVLIPGTTPGSFGCPTMQCPSSAHIDLKENAMAGYGGFAEENVMATSGSFEAGTIGLSSFTEILIAYLRERLIE